MPAVTFIDFNGKKTKVKVSEGTSVMQAAMDNMVEGIVAECGGACACATCHCYVDEKWQDKLSAPEETEQDLLSVANEPQDNSRLSCQITMTKELDGLVVRLPEEQY